MLFDWNIAVIQEYEISTTLENYIHSERRALINRLVFDNCEQNIYKKERQIT